MPDLALTTPERVSAASAEAAVRALQVRTITRLKPCSAHFTQEEISLLDQRVEADLTGWLREQVACVLGADDGDGGAS